MSPEDYYDAIKDDDNDAYNITEVYKRYEAELKNAIVSTLTICFSKPCFCSVSVPKCLKNIRIVSNI